MRFRQKFLGFSGGVMTTLGLSLVILGKDTAYLLDKNTEPGDRVNGATGVPMWTGLVIIMCGMANVVEAFNKQKNRGRTYYDFPFSVVVFMANFIALAVSSVCMGLLSWSIYDKYLQPTLVENSFQQAVIGLYSTIVVACCLIFIFAIMAMFVDCCINGFIGFGGPIIAPPDHIHRESPYDTYNSRPAVLYK